MNDKLKAAIWGAFVADTLALGAHWIYDTRVIDSEFGQITRPMAPLPGSYHPRRGVGQHTHYGDQMLLLLEYVAQHKGFHKKNFIAFWAERMREYDGYIDKATKTTLENIAKGIEEPGSQSDELAGASRLAPLLLPYHDRVEDLLYAAQEQTHATHKSALSTESAKLFARLALEALHGKRPSKALAELEAGMDEHNPLAPLVRQAFDTSDQNSRRGVKRLGQACSAPGALPATLYLLLRHEDDFRECLLQNTMAGGDSAARGILLGTVLGAFHGMEALPKDWLDALQARDRVEQALRAFGL